MWQNSIMFSELCYITRIVTRSPLCYITDITLHYQTSTESLEFCYVTQFPLNNRNYVTLPEFHYIMETCYPNSVKLFYWKSMTLSEFCCIIGIPLGYLTEIPFSYINFVITILIRYQNYILLPELHYVM